MTSFSNFSTNETLSSSKMNMITGGTKTTNAGIDANVVAMLKTKYANAASQQFTMVSKCCNYTVTLDAAKHLMCIKSANGAMIITKY
jgi:hypothetical protein